jgi:hypothetical protein
MEQEREKAGSLTALGMTTRKAKAKAFLAGQGVGCHKMDCYPV